VNVKEQDRHLLRLLADEFPVESRPFRALAERTGATEEDVLDEVRRLEEAGVIRAINAAYDLEKTGHHSLLCAAKVDAEALDETAAYISAFPEVTHNYQRRHAFNVWFALVSYSEARIDEIVERIRGLDAVRELMTLPGERTFKLHLQVGEGMSHG